MGEITRYALLAILSFFTYVATAQDTTNPVAVCTDISIDLDALGMAMITGADIDGGSTDDTAIVSRTASPNTFDCTDVGTPVVVTLTVTDAAGNSDTCTATVTVNDVIAPTAICQDITLTLDGSGMASLVAEDLNGGSLDNCAASLQFTASQTTFGCSDIGIVPVVLTVTDAGGNSATCTANVTVEDTTPPVAVCQNITVALDAMGMATITPSMLDGGSTDNCTSSLTFTASQTSFDCSDVGAQMITLTVEDDQGNSDSCMATVTIEDNTPPTISCSDISLVLDPGTGMVTIDPNALAEVTASDGCGTTTITASQTTFGCGDVLNVPVNDLVLTGVFHGSLTEDLMDPTPDIVDVFQGIELYALQDIPDLSQYGLGVANDGGGTDGQEYSFPAISVTAGSFITVASETTNFNRFFETNPSFVSPIIDIDGNDSVELYFGGNVIDIYGDPNVNPAADPMVSVAWDYTLGWGYRKGNRGPDGMSFILDNWFFSTPGALDLDENATNATTLVPFPTETYVNIQEGVLSPIMVTFSATDANGNSADCIALVSVQDTTPPIAIAQDLTVMLDINGEAFIDVNALDDGSSDLCGIASRIAEPSGFFCDEVGENIVTLTVTDVYDNATTATATITVIDNLAPTMVCENITVQLDDTGNVTVSPDLVGGGSSDVCEIVSTSLSTDTFDCSQVGANTVTFTATDTNGNSDTCTAIITVEDNIAPVVVCQPFTLQLDAMGMATLSPMDIDAGSTDACGIATRSIDRSTFDCSNLGTNDVVLTVTDVNGNAATCTAVVTVEESISPTAIAMDITIGIGTTGSTTISGSDVDNGSTDNCSIASLTVSPNTFTCSDTGAPIPVILTVTDGSGNSSTASANVTVVDDVPPSAICQDITLALDATGNANITVADVDGGSSVSCGTFSASIDVNTFNCSQLGPNNVVLTVTNTNGVSRSCTAVVTVVDNTVPTVVCQDITVVLDPGGNATITAADIDNGSTDNCGVGTTSLDITTFDCDDVGINPVVLTVTDVNGNSNTCTAQVTVIDDVPPTVACQNITVQLDANGLASIDALAVDAGSTDFCGIASRSIDIDSFDCSDLGANTIVLTVTDTSGNMASCNAIVTVEDNIAPTAVCQNITVQLDASGTAIINASDIDNGSSDACGIANIDIDTTLFGCANIGSNTVILSVTDVNGNTSTCPAIVTVEDNVAPAISCQDITVQLDAAGTANITVFDIDGGSTDACGIASSSIDVTAFDCDDVGINSVTLTVSDVNGNVSTCVASVTVQDVEDPVIDCPGTLTQSIMTGSLYDVPDFLGAGIITASDNCSSTLTTLTQSPEIGAQLVEGTYAASLTVQDENGNQESCVFTLVVTDTALGIDTNLRPNAIRMYPNPAQSQLVLESEMALEIEQVRFYDLTGRLVKSVALNAVQHRTVIDVSKLAVATYLVEITANGNRQIQQLIKN